MEESRCRKFYQNISANPSKSCRISSKIVPTCSPNPPKMVPKASRTWRKTSCSHQSEAFTKICQIRSRDSVTFGVQLGPKFDENSNKNQCWKKYVLQTRFFMIWTSFWRCFLKIFWQKNSSNSESMKNRKTLQNTGHASKNGGSASKKLTKNQLGLIKKHKIFATSIWDRICHDFTPYLEAKFDPKPLQIARFSPPKFGSTKMQNFRSIYRPWGVDLTPFLVAGG